MDLWISGLMKQRRYSENRAERIYHWIAPEEFRSRAEAQNKLMSFEVRLIAGAAFTNLRGSKPEYLIFLFPGACSLLKTFSFSKSLIVSKTLSLILINNQKLTRNLIRVQNLEQI